MQVVVCGNCGAKNRVDENRLATSEAKCGRCGHALDATPLLAAIRTGKHH